MPNMRVLTFLVRHFADLAEEEPDLEVFYRGAAHGCRTALKLMVPSGVEDLRMTPEVGLYRCEECDVGFVNPQGLGAHRRTQHVKPKPRRRPPGSMPGVFECPECDKSFTWASSLRRHRKEQH